MQMFLPGGSWENGKTQEVKEIYKAQKGMTDARFPRFPWLHLLGPGDHGRAICAGWSLGSRDKHSLSHHLGR